MLRPPRRFAIHLLLPLLAAAAVAAPVQIPEDAPPLDRLNAHMKKIRGQLKNASVKMRNGVQGLGSGTGDETSLIKSCCGSNLRHIARSARAIDAALPELSECYESAGDHMAVAAVEFYRNDLRALARAMALLQEADGAHNTKMHMDATTRAFLQLRESADALPACPAESAAE